MRKADKIRNENGKMGDLRRKFKAILFGIPFVMLCFSMFIWAVIDGFSWTIVPVLPGGFLYVFCLLTYASFFKSAKHTALINSLLALYVAYLFAVWGSACIFQLFGRITLVIETVAKVLLGLAIGIHYYKYWGKVWESHRRYNESTIDFVNARYDYLSGFDMDENEIKKKAGKQYSNPAVMNIVYFIAPMGGGIGMILFRSQQHTIAFGLMAALSLPVALGILKPVTSQFYIYRKLVKYEKQIGSPLVNGLLD